MTFVPDECLTWWKCEYVHVNFSRRTRVLYFSRVYSSTRIYQPSLLTLALLQTRSINYSCEYSFLDLKILDVKVIDEYALAITDYL